MIKYATEYMRTKLKKIWNVAFADAYDYIDLFFDNYFKEENCLVYIFEGQPVSMLMLIQARLVLEDGAIPVKYIYAVSTLPQHRKKGYSTALINFANEKYGITFLTPAEGELFSFYEKQGYKEAFYIKESVVFRNDKIKTIDFTMKEVSAERYKRIRDSKFAKQGFIEWEIDFLEYALKENSFLGGKACVIEHDGKEDIILYRICEEELIIKETSLEGDLLDNVINELLIGYNLRSCKLRLHFDNPKECPCMKFALIYGVDLKKKAYANIVLD